MVLRAVSLSPDKAGDKFDKSPRDSRLTQVKNLAAIAFTLTISNGNISQVKTRRETESAVTIWSSPLLAINPHAVVPCLRPAKARCPNQPTITTARMRSSFLTCYELADRTNRKDAVVCDLHRKHYW